MFPPYLFLWEILAAADEQHRQASVSKRGPKVLCTDPPKGLLYSSVASEWISSSAECRIDPGMVQDTAPFTPGTLFTIRC